MNKFYIVRHGETINNVAGRLSGWVDTPLTSRGLEPIKSVINKISDIKFGAVYSSDLGRAFITAYYIVKGLRLSKMAEPLAGLREVNYGEAGNMYSHDAYKIYPRLDRDTNYTPPNGESLGVMQKRAFKTVCDLNSKHANCNLLLVAHSGTIASLKALYLGIDFGQHNISEAYAHDYVGVFEIHKDKINYFDELI